MEDLAPPLTLALEVRGVLERGESLRQGLKEYLRNHEGSFSQELGQWLMQFERGLSAEPGPELQKNSYRQTLLQILQAGLEGQSIYEPITILIEEMFSASIDELEEEIRLRPVKILVPMLIFQFPAYLILLLGPILQKVIQGVSL